MHPFPFIDINDTDVFYTFSFVRKVPDSRLPTFRQFDARVRHTDRDLILDGQAPEHFLYVRELRNGSYGPWRGAHKRSAAAAEIIEQVILDARAHDIGTRNLVAACAC